MQNVMMLAVLTLPLSMFLIFATYRLLSYKSDRPCFDNMVYASCSWALLLYLITESLSLLNGIKYTYLTAVWGMICILLILNILRVLRKNSIKNQEALEIVFSPVILEMKSGLMIVAGVFACAVILLAVIIPTYNYDSMVYHCARIAHWAQNHSVRHFATSAVEQIGSPIFAEYINLNVYVLMRKHDNFFNLLQAFSYLYSGLLVKKISEKLGAKKSYQNLSMFLFYAVPIAFAESTTAQVDNVVTVWGLSFVYLIMDLWKTGLAAIKEIENRKKVAAIFVFVGLGYITKPSVCIAMAVALVGMLIQYLKSKEKLSDILKVVVAGGLICIIIALPYFVRNYLTFGSFSPEEVGARQLVGTIHPLYLFVNFVKNFSMNLIQRLTLNSREFLENMVYGIAAVLKVDADAATISENGGAFALDVNDPYRPFNDTAINPLVFYCFIISIIIHFINKRKKVNNGNDSHIINRYARTVIISTVALFTFLRWENYVTRYEIYYLALMCPFIAVTMSNTFDNMVKYSNAAIAVISVFIVADSILLFEYHWDYAKRALDNREAGYFFAWNEIYPEREHAVKLIKESGYDSLGYYNSGNDIEYTIWTMLRDYDIRIENINVNNSSAKYIDKDFSPECILYTMATDDECIEFNGKEYKLIFSEGELTKLYVAE